jgi:hypothetical protein
MLKRLRVLLSLKVASKFVSRRFSWKQLELVTYNLVFARKIWIEMVGDTLRLKMFWFCIL